MTQVVNATNINNVISIRGALSFTSLKIITALLDACILLTSSVVGFMVYNVGTGRLAVASPEGLGVGIVAGILFVIISYSRGFYRISFLIGPVSRVKNVWSTVAMTILLLVSVTFILKVGNSYSRGSMVVFSVFALVLVPVGRLFLARISTIGVECGVIAGRRGLVVGSAAELEKVRPGDLRLMGIEEVARIGVVHSDEGSGLGDWGRAQMGYAINLARELRVSEFVLIIPWAQDVLLGEVCELLRASPLTVKMLPDSTTRKVLSRQGNARISAPLVVEIKREPLDDWERLMKRAVDLVFSVSAAALLAPIFMAAAVAIKLESKGPVLFRQRRVGFDNREFVIYKFRTMSAMDDGDAVIQACRNDSRVTRVGSLLRRSSIDELPQILNIIRGDMSIVGPRPHAVAHHDQYSAQIASYAQRHHMKPGLTGMAQIRGFRGATPQLALMERRVEQDLWYISHWSVRLDLMIIFQTCFALLRDEAY